MSQRNAPLASRSQAAKPAASVAAPPPVAVQEPEHDSDEPAKKQRQAYEPKTALEYEQTTTEITEALRAFKTRLYPTSAPKACLDRAPTRREFDDVISSINALKRDYKAQVRRAEQKPRRKAAPANGKPRTGGFKNPCVVSERLAQFISDNFNTDEMTVISADRICTRALLTSMLTQYAYDHGRRDPSAPAKVIPDSQMLDLFKDDFGPAGVDPAGFPHTHMQKLLTTHVLRAPEFKAYVAANNIDLEAVKPDLERIQAVFKDRKLQREAERPKVKKPSAAALKKAAAAAEALATQAE